MWAKSSSTPGPFCRSAFETVPQHVGHLLLMRATPTVFSSRAYRSQSQRTRQHHATEFLASQMEGAPAPSYKNRLQGFFYTLLLLHYVDQHLARARLRRILHQRGQILPVPVVGGAFSVGGAQRASHRPVARGRPAGRRPRLARRTVADPGGLGKLV
jgi:hypothetical protein